MNRIIRACTLTTYEMDHMNRVYSPEGIAPTIHTCGGGNTEPKILVETAPADGISRRAYIGGGFHMTLSIYGTDGLCPSTTTRTGSISAGGSARL